MLDNLRLDITNSTILNSLTTSNTHVDSTSLTSLKSRFTIWNLSNPTNSSTVPKANADYKDTTTTTYGYGSGKIGVYYNYCAASAGSYCYNTGTGDASYDLCPAGWRMPTGGRSGEYRYLYDAYSWDGTNVENALSTPLSGGFLNGSTVEKGSDGRFWSSTYYSGGNMNYLYVLPGDVYPNTYISRYSGLSLRCIAQ